MISSTTEIHFSVGATSIVDVLSYAGNVRPGVRFKFGLVGASTLGATSSMDTVDGDDPRRATKGLSGTEQGPLLTEVVVLLRHWRLLDFTLVEILLRCGPPQESGP